MPSRVRTPQKSASKSLAAILRDNLRNDMLPNSMRSTSKRSALSPNSIRLRSCTKLTSPAPSLAKSNAIASK